MQMFGEYAKYYDLIYAKKDYAKEADLVYQWAHGPKEICDVGAGTGRHAICWARRGVKVTAVEPSDVMRQLAVLHPNIFYLAKLKGRKKYPCVSALFNVVGYADETIFDAPVRKGGYFIFDCWDADKQRDDPPVFKQEKFGSLLKIVVPHTEDDLDTHIFAILLLKGNKLVAHETHVVTAYSEAEIKWLADMYGFKVIAWQNTETWQRWWIWKKL